MPSSIFNLAFSPCPNDTYMFEALVKGRIENHGLTFNHHLADIEQLNQAALLGKYDVTKMSFYTLMRVLDQYALLDAGSALGRNCGPLVIARKSFALEELTYLKVAIPGKFTTANLLFSLAFPENTTKEEMIFSSIEGAVFTGRVDAGVIIHESRFTYQQKGLVKIIDLGEWWEKETGSPIPLGCIAAKRELGSDKISLISNLIRDSIDFANKNPEVSIPFIKENAREAVEDVVKKHIQLYVNEYSLNLGITGKKAIRILFEKACEKGLISDFPESLSL